MPLWGNVAASVCVQRGNCRYAELPCLYVQQAGAVAEEPAALALSGGPPESRTRHQRIMSAGTLFSIFQVSMTCSTVASTVLHSVRCNCSNAANRTRDFLCRLQQAAESISAMPVACPPVISQQATCSVHLHATLLHPAPICDAADATLHPVGVAGSAVSSLPAHAAEPVAHAAYPRVAVAA